VRQEFSDLTRHAKKRAQDAVVLVMQLIDEDEERTAMLVAVAMHFIDGAAESVKDSYDDEITDEAALASVLGMIISAYGVAKVSAAFKHLRERRAEK